MRAVVALLVAVSLMASGCMGWSTGPDEPAPGRMVRYVASGTAESADVTIHNEQGASVSYECLELPWTYTFDRPFSHKCLYISGRSCTEPGSVTVKIFVGQWILDSDTGYEPYAEATASGCF